MAKKILVVGASGNVGTPLVAALLAKGESLKAASRSGQSFNGTEGVVFDYSEPSTFAAAFDDVDRAYILLPSGYPDSQRLLVPAIQAAAARKIKVVFQSVFGVDADDSIPYRQMELALEKSGTPYVILRPNWFSDNFHTFWKAGIQHGQIAVPAGDGKSSFIDARDIAACAAAALTSEHFDGKAFNLTGPQALGYAEAAHILSSVIGKSITYSAVDDGVFIGMLTSAGVSPDYAGMLASMFHPVRQGWTSAVTGDVEALSGQQPHSLEAYARDHMAELKA